MNTVAIMSALAEPNRVHIVELLREGPSSVSEIAQRLLLRQPQASKHLQVLRAAGIVTVHPFAKQRVYQLRAEPFAELDSWLETFSRTWDERLTAFDAYLTIMKNNQQEKEGEQTHER